MLILSALKPTRLITNPQIAAPIDQPIFCAKTAADKVEMLTIKECTDVIQGLSEHTVRQIVKQGKVKSVRTGEGRNGKILVNKADLIAYFNGYKN